jgi:S1-C subfamily serine protease
MENKPKISLQSSTLVLLVLLALVAGIVGGLGGNYLITILQERGGAGWTASGGASASHSSAKNIASGKMPASFADVAAGIIPSVVNIETVSENAASKEEAMLRRLLPFAAPVPKEREGIGSGVIIRANGIVLTNEHVIKGAQKIQVTLTDGRKFSGHVIGRDPELDIAVVKINASDLPSAKLGNSNELRPGDWALAVGSPLGLSSSVTLGVVSALNRPIRAEDALREDRRQPDCGAMITSPRRRRKQNKRGCETSPAFWQNMG